MCEFAGGSSESPGLLNAEEMTMIERIDAKGWDEICALMGGVDRKTAMKRLKDLGIKTKKGRPCVNIELYKEQSRKHNGA